MMIRKTLSIAAVLAAGLVALPALADNPKAEAKKGLKEAKKDLKEARSDVKEAKKDLKDARKDAREAAKDGGEATGEAKKDAKEALAEARKKLHDSRVERRKATKEAAKAKWGEDLLKKPAVRAELQLHARRTAKLHRMKRLADAKGKEQLETRVDALLAKENARHEQRMEKLKAKNGEDSQ